MNPLLRRLVVVAVASAAVSGCSTGLFEGKSMDYKSAGKLPPLEVPPDLTTPAADGRFVVPDSGGKGSATYSVYAQERQGQSQPQMQTSVLPAIDKVKLERAGSERWLVVQGSPDQVWPVVKDFWQELGFIVNIERPQAGVMETDWAENRAKIPQDIIRSTLGKLFDSIYSTAERDKFRTRLEQGREAGTVEIYISHRGMYEVIEGGDGGNRTVWQPRPADPQIEGEMLQRLMVRFGVDEQKAKTEVAQQAVEQRAELVQREGKSVLLMQDAFDRAWRRVGLALDRVGFAVEDRDRAAGVYYVRYADSDADTSKKSEGFLSKLAFWRSSDEKVSAVQYRVSVKGDEQKTEVTVLGEKGQPASTETTQRILKLLLEQLK